MPSKRQKRQLALKLKLREDVAATRAANEAARQAVEAAKQGNTVSGITPRLLSLLLLLRRQKGGEWRHERLKQCCSSRPNESGCTADASRNTERSHFR